MLSDDKLHVLESISQNWSKEELIWAHGFIAARLGSPATAAVSAQGRSLPPKQKLTILYGTETGNAKRIATELAARAKSLQINARLVAMDQYAAPALEKEKQVAIILSTHGDGEPPESARGFFRSLHEQPLSLSALNYSVLALGDTAYPLFCKAGEEVDLQLAALGAQRLQPMVKLDTDFEGKDQWVQGLFNALHGSAVAPLTTVAQVKRSGKQKTTGQVRVNIQLNGRGSAKQTHHIEIEAEGLSYEPGDAIGVVPPNPAAQVDRVLQLLQADGDQLIAYRDEMLSLRDLFARLNIHRLPPRTVAQYAALAALENPPEAPALADLLALRPVPDVSQLINILEPVAPRLYSIASSPAAHEGEVHITVGREPGGLCSNFLADLAQGTLAFYVQPNHQFRLPSPETDIIMVGAGTGIAPFRSFVAERDATGATGRNWLFFGEQHFVSDFLYQTEWQNWFATGTLTRVSLAFSRDQPQKRYVQHRLREQATELIDWLGAGACLYICGSKKMGSDVESTLREILPASLFENLQSENRILKDVY